MANFESGSFAGLKYYTAEFDNCLILLLFSAFVQFNLGIIRVEESYCFNPKGLVFGFFHTNSSVCNLHNLFEKLPTSLALFSMAHSAHQRGLFFINQSLDVVRRPIVCQLN